MSDFSHLRLKSYDFWEIYVHENQGYLGRCVLWCKREDALALTHATVEEQHELFLVLRALEVALRHCFQPNLLNYAFLGNQNHHLHCHVIPRYEESRSFMGHTFNDFLFGENYKTDYGFVYDYDLLQKVKRHLKRALQ